MKMGSFGADATGPIFDVPDFDRNEAATANRA